MTIQKNKTLILLDYFLEYFLLWIFEHSLFLSSIHRYFKLSFLLLYTWRNGNSEEMIEKNLVLFRIYTAG